MSIINMAKTIKEVHPDYVIIYKVGEFYNCYNRDAYILSYLMEYSIRAVSKNNYVTGFPKNSLNKVKAKLENRKINYLCLDPRNNYYEDEKSDNGNLNKYNEIFSKANEYVKKKRAIENISDELEEKIDEENFWNIITKIKGTINERGEI